MRKKSWKTTAAGVAGAVAAVGTALQAYWDGDPSTIPEWGLVATAVALALGLLVARDGDK